jgi:hypothetical protein
MLHKRSFALARSRSYEVERKNKIAAISPDCILNFGLLFTPLVRLTQACTVYWYTKMSSATMRAVSTNTEHHGAMQM